MCVTYSGANIIYQVSDTFPAHEDLLVHGKQGHHCGAHTFLMYVKDPFNKPHFLLPILQKSLQ